MGVWRRPVSAVLPRQCRLLSGRNCQDRLRVPEQSGSEPADGNRCECLASRIGELRRERRYPRLFRDLGARRPPGAAETRRFLPARGVTHSRSKCDGNRLQATGSRSASHWSPRPTPQTRPRDLSSTWTSRTPTSRPIRFQSMGTPVTPVGGHWIRVTVGLNKPMQLQNPFARRSCFASQASREASTRRSTATRESRSRTRSPTAARHRTGSTTSTGTTIRRRPTRGRTSSARRIRAQAIYRRTGRQPTNRLPAKRPRTVSPRRRATSTR